MSVSKKRRDNPFFKDGVDYAWQTTKEFNDFVKDFRDKNALSPNMKDARQMHTTIISELMKKLKEKPLRCSRLEYTGSAYEGVKVSKGKDDDDLEFDIMVIIEGGRDLKKDSSETPPGYVLLQPSDESGSTRFHKQTTDGYVSADKVASHFMGQLSACIDEIQVEKLNSEDAPEELKHIKDNITLRKHGPAIQMDVFRSSSELRADGTRKIFYSVDMVPTFEMILDGSQKEYYVAKPVKGADFAKAPKLKFAWRRSFSLDEKDRLYDMDKNNTCKKSIFRMLKVIRNRECGLALLTSYHLKTVLLRELEHRPEDEDWKEEHIGQRLMDVISRLVSELGSEIERPPAAKAVRLPVKQESTKRMFRKGRMPHLFIPQINLLDGIDHKAWAPIYYRFKHLKNSRKQMEVILNVGEVSKPRRKKKSKKAAVAAKDKSAAAKTKTKKKAVSLPGPLANNAEFINVLNRLLANFDCEVQVNEADEQMDATKEPPQDHVRTGFSDLIFDNDVDDDDDDCGNYEDNCDADDYDDFLDMSNDTGEDFDYFF